jgi:hypothetical protein
MGSPFCESSAHLKVGIAQNVKDGIWPINGLHHPLQGDTSGWYIWAGEELSFEADFFKPLHIEHLNEWCPAVLKYLGLSPGWRFLLAKDYEDVWKDISLLDIS